MSHGLDGKQVVITGSSRGIGLGIAQGFARAGARLLLIADDPKVVDRARDLGGAGAVADITDGKAVAAALAATPAIDVLINNAGLELLTPVTEADAETEAKFRRIVEINVIGTDLVTRRALARMKAGAAIINTASMAGLLNPPTMGIYNVSKHAVVSLTESLYHDLSLVEAPIGASVLCPYFVQTGISQSHKRRPDDVRSDSAPTVSQQVSQAVLEKAVSSGKVSAADVAQRTFDAIRAGQFYIYSHPGALGNVQRRMEDIVTSRNPGDPYEAAPHVRDKLRAGLRGEGV